jgi:hypothetical protein
MIGQKRAPNELPDRDMLSISRENLAGWHLPLNSSEGIRERR